MTLAGTLRAHVAAVVREEYGKDAYQGECQGDRRGVKRDGEQGSCETHEGEIVEDCDLNVHVDMYIYQENPPYRQKLQFS